MNNKSFCLNISEVRIKYVIILSSLVLMFVLITFGFIFSTLTPSKYCLGDYIFNFLNLPGWSGGKPEVGFHYTVLISVILIVFGYIGARNYLFLIDPRIAKSLPIIYVTANLRSPKADGIA